MLMQVVVSGLMTHYQRQGNGKVVLLLHGWADRKETFQAILPALTEKYTVVTLDLPGFGQSQAPKEAWGLDDYAKFVQAFLKKLNIADLHGVIGHSNGGALAIRAVAQEQLEPKKLILLAASGVRDNHGVRKLGLKAVAKTGKAATFWLPKATKNKLQKKFYGTIGSDMLVAPELRETFKRTVKQDIQADAANIVIPTLLIYGEQDRATPISAVGKRLHKLIKDSKLITVPDADHFVHHASSYDIAKTIIGFLR